jgi:hypothetical protein
MDLRFKIFDLRFSPLVRVLVSVFTNQKADSKKKCFVRTRKAEYFTSNSFIIK